MKRKCTRVRLHVACVLGVIIGCLGGRSSLRAAAGDAGPLRERVGVYDSRVVAYAWFWSETGTQRREQLLAAARAAKQDGDAERLRVADAAVRAYQDANHLQVFSTAPVEELLATIADQLPAVMAAAGVTRLVSKWEAGAPAVGGEAVDVTDALAAAFFTPDEKQARVIAAIKHQQPLPLEQARELLRQGKL